MASSSVSRRNYGEKTEYVKPNDWKRLVERAEPGDLIEFERCVFYSHWATYVGYRSYKNKGKVPCVVHSGGNAEEATCRNLVLLGQSLHKGQHGIGASVLQPLEEVILGSRLRVNNSSDKKHPPFTSDEIVYRALSSVSDDDVREAALEEEEENQRREGHVWPPINGQPLVTVEDNEYHAWRNNCEHKSKKDRYGVRESDQVDTAIAASATIGTVAVIGIAGLIVAAVFSSDDSRSPERNHRN